MAKRRRVADPSHNPVTPTARTLDVGPHIIHNFGKRPIHERCVGERSFTVHFVRGLLPGDRRRRFHRHPVPQSLAQHQLRHKKKYQGMQRPTSHLDPLRTTPHHAMRRSLEELKILRTPSGLRRASIGQAVESEVHRPVTAAMETCQGDITLIDWDKTFPLQL